MHPSPPAAEPGPYQAPSLLASYIPARIASDTFSAVISTGKFVLAHGTTGKIEASVTRNPVTPRTRPTLSVTAIGSSAAPMRQEQEACHTPTEAFRTKASSF